MTPGADGFWSKIPYPRNVNPLALYCLLARKFLNKIISKLITFPLIAFSVAISLLGALTTNAVPPITEAVYLKMKYGFMYNIDFLKAGRSSSFLYNTYFKNSLSLIEYYEIIFGIVIGIVFIVLLYFPLISSLLNRSTQKAQRMEKKKERRFFGGN